MSNSFFAKAKNAAILPLAIGASLLQAGCSLVSEKGEISYDSIYFIVASIAAVVICPIFDVFGNGLENSQAAGRNAAEGRLASLGAKGPEASLPCVSGQYSLQQKKPETRLQAETQRRHASDVYKSWYDMPGMKRRPTGRDEPEREAPVFKTWDEAIGGREYTKSFGKDFPSTITGSPRMTVCNRMLQGATRKGAPEPIIWR